MGASDTGLACIEALLTSPRHSCTSYTYLTLLSPGGVGGSSSRAGQKSFDCCYSRGVLARLGVEGAVAVVDGALAAVDREARVVVLQDGGEVPYDLLVTVTGLQVGGG